MKIYQDQGNSGSNLLHFDVMAQGVPFKALLDCGASTEYIDLAAAERRNLKMQRLESPYEVRLADSTAIKVEYVIPTTLKLRKCQ